MPRHARFRGPSKLAMQRIQCTTTALCYGTAPQIVPSTLLHTFIPLLKPTAFPKIAKSAQATVIPTVPTHYCGGTHLTALSTLTRQTHMNRSHLQSTTKPRWDGVLSRESAI